jgi:hypothetical protein
MNAQQMLFQDVFIAFKRQVIKDNPKLFAEFGCCMTVCNVEN